MPKRYFRFDPTSFFPRYKLEDILRVQFELLYKGHQPINDQIDFRELIWFYETLAARVNENNESSGNMIDQFRSMMGQG